jgi:hypothetical protein
MRTCVLAHTETLPANKITKKSGKNRDGHLKQKKERTYALFQCVHAYMCTRSKKSQPELKKSQPFEAAPESGGAFLHAGLNNVFCPLIKNKK